MAGKKGYGACLGNFCFVDILRKTVVSLCFEIYTLYVLDFGLIRIIYEDAIKKCTRIKMNQYNYDLAGKKAMFMFFQRFRKNVLLI